MTPHHQVYSQYRRLDLLLSFPTVSSHQMLNPPSQGKWIWAQYSQLACMDLHPQEESTAAAITSEVCCCRSTFGLMSNCRANSRLSFCRRLDKKYFSSSIVWGGKEVARLTKAILYFVNMDVGILSGMLAVAKVLGSMWSKPNSKIL